MPFFRGIEISVHASLEAKQITEYPHPDGSSVRLLRATEPAIICGNHPGGGRVLEPNASSPLGETDPTRLKKVNPRISVYIPSLPGMLVSLFAIFGIILIEPTFRRAILATLSHYSIPAPITMHFL